MFKQKTFLVAIVLLFLTSTLAVAQNKLTDADRAVIRFEIKVDEILAQAKSQGLDVLDPTATIFPGPMSVLGVNDVKRISGCINLPKDFSEITSMGPGKDLPVEGFVRFALASPEAVERFKEALRQQCSASRAFQSVVYRSKSKNDPQNMMFRKIGETEFEFLTDKYLRSKEREHHTPQLAAQWNSIPNRAVRIAADLVTNAAFIKGLAADAKQKDPFAGQLFELLTKLNSLGLSAGLDGKQLLALAAAGNNASDAEAFQSGVNSLLQLAATEVKGMLAGIKDQSSPLVSDGAEVLDSLRTTRAENNVQVNVVSPPRFTAAMGQALFHVSDVAQGTTRANNLKIAALGCLNFESAHARFPFNFSESGKAHPDLSWQAQISPFVEGPQTDGLKAPSAPENAQFVTKMPPSFGDDKTHSNISWIQSKVKSFGDITDGSSNTICLIENPNTKTPWLERNDISIEDAIKLVKALPNGKHLWAARYDGSTLKLAGDMEEKTLRMMFDPSDGGIIGPDQTAKVLEQRSISAQSLKERGDLDGAIKMATQTYDSCFKIAGPDKHLPLLWNLSQQLARLHTDNSDFEKAIAVEQKFIDWGIAKLGSEHPKVVDQRAVLAVTLGAAGRTAEAIEAADSIALDAGTPSMMASMRLRILNWHSRVGNHDEVLEQCPKVLDFAIAKDDPAMVRGVVNVAVISSSALKREADAIPVATKALDFSLKKFGEENLLTARLLVSFAKLQRGAKEQTNAIASYKRALPQLIRESGAQSTEVGDVQHAVASAYVELNQPEKAIVFEQKSLNTLITQLGNAHSLTLERMAFLESIYRSAGNETKANEVAQTIANTKQAAAAKKAQLEKNLAEAKAAFETASAKTKGVHGPTAATLITCYLDSGRPDDAFALAKDQAKLSFEDFGLQSLEANNANYLMAQTIQKVRGLKEAIEVRQNFGNVLTERLGPNHQATLAAQTTTAGMLWGGGQRKDAVEMMQAVILKLNVNPGADSLPAMNGTKVLADWFHEAKVYDQALPLYESVFPKFKAGPAPENDKALDCALKMGKIYMKSNPAKAVEMHKFLFDGYKAHHLLSKESSLIMASQAMLADAYLNNKDLENAEKSFQNIISASSKDDQFVVRTIEAKRGIARVAFARGQYSISAQKANDLIGEIEGKPELDLPREIAQLQVLMYQSYQHLPVDRQETRKQFGLKLFEEISSGHPTLSSLLPAQENKMVSTVSDNTPLFVKEAGTVKPVGTVKKGTPLWGHKPSNLPLIRAYVPKLNRVCWLLVFDIEPLEFTRPTMEKIKAAIGVHSGMNQSADPREQSLKNFQDAIDDSKKEIAVHPMQAVIFGRIALAHSAVGDFEKSIQYYQKSSDIWDKLEPDNLEHLEVKYNLVEELTKRNQVDKARQTAASVMEKVGKHLDAAMDSSDANLKRRTTRIANASTWLVVWRGDSIVTDQHVAAMEKVVSISPKGMYYNTLGVALYRTGKYEQAIAAHERSLTLTPKELNLPGPHPVDLAVIAMCHHRTGNKASAEEFKTRAVSASEHEIFKNDSEVKSFLQELKTLDGSAASPQLMK
jgi:tetratricopeptide (TPR) repeat protein